MSPISPNRRAPRRHGHGRGAAVAALAAGLLLGLAPHAVAAGQDEAPDDVPVSGSACEDAGGVDVVVDFPAPDGADEAPGEVRLGCAPEAGVTGTEALNAAGFTDTRDAATMICAIDEHPDPCPAEFTGSFWSYWYADTEGDDAGTWQQYMEGSDTAVTQEGRVEGWRYGDGSEPPRIDPTALVTRGDAGDDATADDEAGAGGGATDEDAATGAADGTEEDPAASSESEDASTDATEASGGVPGWALVVGAVVLVAVVGVLVAVLRRRPSAHGPAAQD